MVVTLDMLLITNGVAVALILAAVKGIFSVKTELRLLGDRLIKLETWVIEHEKYVVRTESEMRQNMFHLAQSVGKPLSQQPPIYP